MLFRPQQLGQSFGVGQFFQLQDGIDEIVKNILPTVEAFLGAISGQRS